MSASTNNYINVIEIWATTPDKQQLRLVDGFYGKFDELKRVSEQTSFNYDEGLPGKAWSNARPLILADLEHSYFQRKESAARAGLNAGLAIPIFAGEFLIAVVVMLCGELEDAAGAIELWGRPQKSSTELSLMQGYYGSLSKLQTASRQIRFAKGHGLPGSVWDYRIPMVVADMSDASLFKRASTAAIEGITSAIGLPFSYYTGDKYVLTFLSAHRTPIAQRFEIWIADREQHHLFFHTGVGEQGEDLSSLYHNTHIKRGAGLLGKVWQTGIPAISTDLVGDRLLVEGSSNGLSTGLVMPIIEEGFLKAMVVLLF